MVSASESENPSSIFHHKGNLIFITLAPHCELKTSVASSISAIDGSRVSAMSGGSMVLKIEVFIGEVGCKEKRNRVSTEGMRLYSHQIDRS